MIDRLRGGGAMFCRHCIEEVCIEKRPTYRGRRQKSY
jgi:hypothetical protein